MLYSINNLMVALHIPFILMRETCDKQQFMRNPSPKSPGSLCTARGYKAWQQQTDQNNSQPVKGQIKNKRT